MARAPGGGSRRGGGGGGDEPAKPTKVVRKARAAVDAARTAAGDDTRTNPAPATERVAPLSIDDVTRLRDRIERVSLTPGTALGATGNPATDGVLALGAEKLRAARAEDARRIAALQARLEAADRTAAAERARADDLNARLDENGKALAEGSARIAALEKALAAQRSDAAQAAEEVDAGLQDALDTADALLAELAQAQARDAGREKELGAAKDGLARAQREVEELRATQRAQVDGSRVVGAESVAALLDEFVGSFRTRLGGLQVASGEVQLKAAFAAVGDRARFVLPAAGAKTADLPVLHDIRLKLDPRG